MNYNNHDKYLKLPYRQGVGLMIINDEQKVFVGRRIDTKNEAWQMPQGGIDHGEDPKTAALREMLEEIGTNNGTILAETKKTYKYDLPIHLIHKLWNGRYKGQEQKWFLIKFEGKDKDIDINYSEHPEFIEWKWVEKEELIKIIVPFKRQFYIDVMEEFMPITIKLKTTNTK